MNIDAKFECILTLPRLPLLVNPIPYSCQIYTQRSFFLTCPPFYLPSLSLSFYISLSATPEPATNFRVTATTNTTMSLAWEKQFNGLLTITGGALEYITGGSSPTDMTVSGTTATLTSLTPLAFYNVTLFVTNRLGRSAPVSLIQQTVSNREFFGLFFLTWFWFVFVVVVFLALGVASLISFVLFEVIQESQFVFYYSCSESRYLPKSCCLM